MSTRKGLFHVINGKTEETLGTAFAVKQANNTNYYVITAFHVVAEAIALGEPIIIRDEERSCHSIRMISSQLDSEEYCHPGKDYAVFELVTAIQYDSFFISTSENLLQQCYIRGTGIHFKTEFIRIIGQVLGVEKEKNTDINTLTIKMPVYSYSPKSDLLKDQDVLKGMSGSPIVVLTGEREECIGVLGNVGQDRNGFVRYGVPISNVLSDPCFATTDPIFEQSKNYSDIDYKITFLFENDPNDFVFYDEVMDQLMWKKISNSFFRGIPIDDELDKILLSEEIKTYSAEVRMALYYYYSRLLFKRGRIDYGQKALSHSLELEKSVSQKSREKLFALANGRMLIENSKLFKSAEQVRFAGFNISEIPEASDSYIAYETASLYGKGLINLFSIKNEFSSSEKEDMKRIYQEQTRLFNNHKEVLERQDVVITAVEWYLGLWKIDSSITDAFENTIKKGFSQSKIRKNDIFHLQSLIAYSIYLLQTAHNNSAMIILTLCAIIMRNLKIYPNHEGIAQLLYFMRHNYRKEHATLQIIFSSTSQNEILSKLDSMDVDTVTAPWKSIIEYAIEIYQELYVCFLEGNKKTIYNVKLNDIMGRLFF